MAERLLHPLDLLPGLAETVGLLAEPALEGEGMVVERLALDLPFEMQVLREGGGIALTASPPTQKTETSIMPVWHRLALTVEVVEDA
jgi:hypothetical protein